MVPQIAKQPQIPSIPVYTPLYIVILLHLPSRGRVSFSILETGLGPVTCFDQWDISKYDQKLEKYLSTELALFCWFWNLDCEKKKKK